MAVKIVRQPKKIALIGAPSSAAAFFLGSEKAPAALRAPGSSSASKPPVTRLSITVIAPRASSLTMKNTAAPAISRKSSPA